MKYILQNLRYTMHCFQQSKCIFETMASKCFLRAADSTEIDLVLGETYLNEFAVSKMDLEKKNVLVSTLPDSAVIFSGYRLDTNAQVMLCEDDQLKIGGVKYEVKFAGMKRSLDSPDGNVVKKVPKFEFIKFKNDMQERRHNEHWKQLGNNVLIYTSSDCMPSSLIASFDLDGTLIKTKSGKTFPTNESDWCLFSMNTNTKIEKYIRDEYKFVIFTNQFSLYNNITKINSFKQKIERIVNKLNVPVQVFAAMAKDFHRKPCIGMWNLLQERNGNVLIDMEKSFYVGDAAGRTPRSGKKDFSNADRLFAFNLNLKFLTPDEFFLNKPPEKFEMPILNPAELKTLDYDVNKSSKQEVVLLVGAPGSGKSTFCKNHYTDHVIVNQDKLGNAAKCLKVLEDALRTGKSAVVDNVNRDVASREKYIKLANQFKAPVRCFELKTSKELCFHNNKFREMTDTSHVKVGDPIIHAFFKYYQPPTKDEGINEIVKFDFSVQLHDPDVESLYRMYLLEK